MVTERGKVFEFMGRGYKIRVPRKGRRQLPELVKPNEPIGAAPVFRVYAPLFRQMVREHDIFQLTEDRNGQRAGWRELGYDGDVADWYVLMQ